MRTCIRVVLIAAIGGLASCVSPLERTLEQQLREQLVTTNQRYQQAAAPGHVVELTREPSDVEQKLTDERRRELDAISGPEAYREAVMDLGADLRGDADSPTIAMSLRQAIRLAIQNNLDVQFAQLGPAITQTQVAQALAVFDAVFFADYEYSDLDSVTPPPAGGFFDTAFGSTQTETHRLATGIRKRLTSGGRVTVMTEFTHNRRTPPLYELNPYYGANFALLLEQPLLRNFGADVNRQEILLAQSAQRQAVQDLREQLLNTLLDVERAYWNLVFARQRLLIQRRLLERTVADRNRLEPRLALDVTQVQFTQANSFVELRRAEVIRARQEVRVASDQLKRLINAPELSIASETMIVPLDRPADAPVQFSLHDAIVTALRERPELQRALLQISDASIRQRVADNLRLPRLDLTGTIRYNGVAEDFDDAYEESGEGDYIDYIIGLAFEQPIGNRGPQAFYQQRKLERRASVINYRNQAQFVVLEVKTALRQLISAYELIGATRAARRAAADNLRALEEQEAAGAPLTPEFLLDLKLTTQDRLADAETQEIQALTDYSAAIAGFYRAIGTLMEYNQVEFSTGPVQ